MSRYGQQLKKLQETVAEILLRLALLERGRDDVESTMGFTVDDDDDEEIEEFNEEITCESIHRRDRTAAIQGCDRRAHPVGRRRN